VNCKLLLILLHFTSFLLISYYIKILSLKK